ncbi:MAG: thermonuclease family protein [Cyclobacteriaceae bacterium]|nr:thermonuclease family protein [Cyclobacteriaceae bacterium]
MKTLLTLLTLSVTVFVAEANTVRGKVVSVVDGNTLEVVSTDKETYRIVLMGIDCPEFGQPYADEARRFLEQIVLQKSVNVKLMGKDRWGNYLGEITTRDINAELVKRGLAWCTEKDASEELKNLEQRARNQRAGLWQEEEPTPPWVYRRQQTMLAPKGL